MKDSYQFLLINIRLLSEHNLSADEKLLTSLIGGHDLRTHNEYYENPLYKRYIMYRLGWSLSKTTRNIASLIDKGYAERDTRTFEEYGISEREHLQLTPEGTQLYRKSPDEMHFVVFHNLVSSKLFDERISSQAKLLISLAYSFERKGGTLHMSVQTLAKRFNVSERSVDRLMSRLKADGWLISIQGSSKKMLTRQAADLVAFGDNKLREIYSFNLPSPQRYERRELNFRKGIDSESEQSLHFDWYCAA